MDKKQGEKKKIKSKVKRPNGLIYFIGYIMIYPILRILFRFKVDRSNYNPPKGPFIVLSNHTSYMDFLLAMMAPYPRRVNTVAAQIFFLSKPLDRLLPAMGCIPKNLFDPDVRSIMQIKEVLGRGGRVLMFPEGRCSVAGEFMGMHKATGKLIKNLGVPVISCRIEGAYFCMPFWRKSPRRGKMRATLANLLTAEEIGSMSADEINTAVNRRLCGEDQPNPLKARMARARKLTQGLEDLLYLCPRCNQEFTMVTQRNTVRCSACGNTAKMNRYGGLTPVKGGVAPESVHHWYKEEIRHEMRFLSEDMEPISTEVTVRMPLRPGCGLEPCGHGTLSLEPKGWHYDGELHGEKVHLFFPIETVPAMPFDPNDNIQIYAHGQFFNMRPDNAHLCVKFATLAECAYWRFVRPVKMTPGFDSGFDEYSRS